MEPYRLQIASDIQRDGLGVELLDGGGNCVAEVFRCDRDHTLTLSTFCYEVPLQAIQQLVSTATEGLGPFEDGTPLADAELCEPRRADHREC